MPTFIYICSQIGFRPIWSNNVNWVYIVKQIKITFVDKLNEFRFLAMLGNIKTHGRNILGNVGMYSLQTFKDAVAAIGEDVYNKVIYFICYLIYN